MPLAVITSTLLLVMTKEYQTLPRQGTKKTGSMETTSAHIQTSSIKHSTTPAVGRKSIRLHYIQHTPTTPLITSNPQPPPYTQTPPWPATTTPKTHHSSPHHSPYSAHSQNENNYHLQLSSPLSLHPHPHHNPSPNHQTTTTNSTPILATSTTPTTSTEPPSTK